MTPNEYQKEALRTASGMSKEYPRILNGLMGLNGEAGVSGHQRRSYRI